MILNCLIFCQQLSHFRINLKTKICHNIFDKGSMNKEPARIIKRSNKVVSRDKMSEHQLPAVWLLALDGRMGQSLIFDKY